MVCPRSAVSAPQPASGKIHTADEEESLFPRLRPLGDAVVDRIIAELEGQHREADPLHDTLDSLCDRAIAQHSLAAGDAAELVRVAAAFLAIYPGHIRKEDGELFPRAGELLQAAEWDVVWQEMRQRRDLLGRGLRTPTTDPA